jgi:hypothetical protein
MRIPKVKISSQVRIPCNVWIVSENIAKMLDYVEESRVCLFNCLALSFMSIFRHLVYFMFSLKLLLFVWMITFAALS